MTGGFGNGNQNHIVFSSRALPSTPRRSASRCAAFGPTNSQQRTSDHDLGRQPAEILPKILVSSCRLPPITSSFSELFTLKQRWKKLWLMKVVAPAGEERTPIAAWPPLQNGIEIPPDFLGIDIPIQEVFREPSGLPWARSLLGTGRARSTPAGATDDVHLKVLVERRYVKFKIRKSSFPKTSRTIPRTSNI